MRGDRPLYGRASLSMDGLGGMPTRREEEEMNEDQIAKLTLDMLGDLMHKLPTKREKSDALGTLMLAAYNLLRTTEGDEFVRGWLESALADIAANPPACEFRVPH